MPKLKTCLLVIVTLAIAFTGILTACAQAPAAKSPAATTTTTTTAKPAKVYEWSCTSVLAESAAQSKGMVAYWDAVEKKTNGGIKIKQYTWNGALLKTTNLLEGLRDRVVDVAFVSNVYWPTKTPLSNALQPVFLNDFSAVAPVEAQLYQNVPELKAEWLKWNVVPVAWFAGADQVLLSNFKFSKLEDLKGKKIRALGSSMSAAVARWGGVPVAMASADCYEGLQKGTVDMISGFPAYALVSNKMAEVSKQITNFRYGGWCMWFGVGVNKAAWDELPAEYQKILMDTAEEAAKGEAIANEVDAMAGFKIARQLGQEIVQLTPETALEWQKVMDPTTIWEDNIKAAETAGYKDVRANMNTAVKAVKDYDATHPSKTIMERFFDLEKAGK